MTFERATAAACDELAKYLGNEELTSSEIERARLLIRESGSVEVVEELIEGLLTNALQAASSEEISPQARELLVLLATSATRRTM
jgi:geranylgeranyl diphosphate synthase type I